MDDVLIILLAELNEEETREREVFAERGSITQAEFNAAAQKELKPEYRFIIYAFEYDGEEKIRFEGEEYYIYRTYQKPGSDRMELYTSKRIGRR